MYYRSVINLDRNIIKLSETFDVKEPRAAPKWCSDARASMPINDNGVILEDHLDYLMFLHMTVDTTCHSDNAL